MCEHVVEVAEECVRANSVFPPVVEEHRKSCASCSQHIAFITLMSSTGRPQVQLPPADLTTRIASLTYAKQSLWQQLVTRPAVFAPALGVLVAAGWMLSGIGDTKKAVQVTSNVEVIKSPAVAEQPATESPKISSRVKRAVQPVRSIGDRVVLAAKPATGSMSTRQDVERMSDSTIGDDAPIGKKAFAIPQNPELRVSDVKSSDVASVRTGTSRVPEISVTADHKIDVEAPLSTRRTFGRSSIVLASTDEAAEADELRASFQSQLNRQSDAFRNTNVQASQPVGDSARINVVNAPVGNGGK